MLALLSDGPSETFIIRIRRDPFGINKDTLSSSSWLKRQSSLSSCWSDQGLAITFLIQLRVMTQRQHVPTTEYPPTPHKFWFQQSIPTHHNPTGGAILALGEPSPGGAHFHLHRFLSLRIRPLLCSYLLRPPPPHSSRYKMRGREREERGRKGVGGVAGDY